MQGDEYEALKADIAENGLRELIWLHPDGRILDGRNRYCACRDTETEPHFRTWDGKGSLVNFVVSMNLHRRHLTSGQRAMIAAKLANMPVGRPEINAPIGAFNQPRAASVLNVSTRSVQRARQVLDNGIPELQTAIEQGRVSITPAAEAATELSSEEQNHFTTLTISGMAGTKALQAARSGPSQAVAVTVFSSESVEYYTPSKYIEAARQVMGGIDLDPASCESAQEIVKAAQYYTKADDGLAQKWEGRCWLNPPYGKIRNKSSQGQWGQHLLSEYHSGNVSEAILLVKAATGYEWFEKLWDELPVCFARERLSFIRENGNNDGSSKQGTAFFYIGENVEQFIKVFAQFGRIVLPGDQR